MLVQAYACGLMQLLSLRPDADAEPGAGSLDSRQKKGGSRPPVKLYTSAVKSLKFLMAGGWTRFDCLSVYLPNLSSSATNFVPHMF